ncbi:MAG: glycosyltransferase family 39 protein [Candidatus Theseobacter exili]|nr:glycosyltransferase family 39 protein [Candidatus Theseobacter exili]
MIIETTIIKPCLFILLILSSGFSILFRIRSKATEKNPETSIIEAFYISVLTGIVISGLAGLILASTGFFNYKNLIFIQCLCTLLFWQGKKYNKATILFLRPTKSELCVLIIILASAFFFLKPFEYIMGGWDPSSYLNTGINTANTGSISIQDPILEKMSIKEQTAFAHKRNSLLQKYPGFPIVDSKKAKILPGFYYFYPVWIAIISTVSNAKMALYTNAIFGLLSLLGLFYMAKSIFGEKTALISVLLLAANLAQIWHVRFPTSEILTQFLIFSGLYTLQKFITSSTNRTSLFFGILTSLCFAEAFTTRITTLLALIPIFIYFEFRSFNPIMKKHDKTFIKAFVILILAGALYNIFIASAPTNLLMKSSTIKKLKILSIPVLFIGLIVFQVLRRNFTRLQSWNIWSHTITKSTLNKIAYTAFTLLLVGYLFASKIPLEFFTNLRQLGWFISPLGLFSGLLGLYLLIISKPSKQAVPFIIIFVFVTFAILWDRQIHNSFMWAERRYLPVIIPSFLILSSYALTFIWKKLPSVISKSICLIIGLLILLHPITINKPILKIQDYKGTWDFCERLSNLFNNDDILICYGSWLALPLSYIFGKTTLQISDQEYAKRIPFAKTILNSIDKWLIEGKRVYYLSQEEQPFSNLINFIPIEKTTLVTKVLERRINSMPEKIENITIPLTIYRLEKIPNNFKNKENKYLIDIGHENLSLISGFYDQESCLLPDLDSKTYRWTNKKASMKLDISADDIPQIRKIHLSLKSFRPTGIPPAEIQVSIANENLCTLKIPSVDDFNKYTIDIPGGLLNKNISAQLVLAVNIWNPSADGTNRDKRDLGVVVEKIELVKKDNSIETFNIESINEKALEGFHKLEWSKNIETSVRWTGRKGCISIPWFGKDKKNRLIIRMAGGRYSDMEKAVVRLLINRKLIWRSSISHDFNQYIIDIPVGTVEETSPGRVKLVIKSNTWSPKDTGHSNDRRKLGVVLDWIKIEKLDY